MKLNNKEYSVVDLARAPLGRKELKELCTLIHQDQYPAHNLVFAQYKNMKAYEQIAQALLNNKTITEVVLINPEQLSLKAGMAFIKKAQSTPGFSLEALQGKERMPASLDTFVLPNQFSAEDFEVFIDQVQSGKIVPSKIMVSSVDHLTGLQIAELRSLARQKQLVLVINNKVEMPSPAGAKAEASPVVDIPAELFSSSIGGAAVDAEIPAELFVSSSITGVQQVTSSDSAPTLEATEDAPIDPLLASTNFGSATADNDEDEVMEELNAEEVAPVCDVDGVCDNPQGPSFTILTQEAFMKKYITNPVIDSDEEDFSDEDDAEFSKESRRAMLIPAQKPESKSEVEKLTDEVSEFIKNVEAKLGKNANSDDVTLLFANDDDEHDAIGIALEDDSNADDEERLENARKNIANPDINSMKKAATNSVLSRLKPVHGVYAVAVLCLGALAVYTASVYVVIAVVAAVAAPIVIIGALTLKDMCKVHEESVTQL